MKKWTMIMMGVLLVNAGQSQTFSEWFRQKSTQIKYLHQQIAALQIMIGEMEEGSSIVRKGTDLIGTIKQEDQDQHSEHFTALKQIKPVISKDDHIRVIGDWRNMIVNICNACKQEAVGLWLDPEEQAVVKDRLEHLVADADADCAILNRIISGGYVEMKDGERLQRIGDLYEGMKRRVAATIGFRRLVESIIFYRQHKKNDRNGVRALYGLK